MADNGGLAAAMQKITKQMTAMGNRFDDMEKRLDRKTPEAADSEHYDSDDELPLKQPTGNRARRR